MQRRAHESTSGVPVQWPVSVVQKPLGLRQSEKIPSNNFRVQRLEMAKQMLSVAVTSSGGLDDDYAARIKSLLMEEILSAGTTIRLQTFIRPIMESVSGVDYVEIRGLLSEKPDIEGVADNSMLTGIVPVEINQQPVLSMSGIRVVKA